MSRKNRSPWMHRLMGWIERLLRLDYLQSIPASDREELREHVQFVRRTLFNRRAPRIAVVGSRSLSMARLLSSMAGEVPLDDLDIKSRMGRGRWYDYELRNDAIEILDLRDHDGDAPSLRALERKQPDVVLFCWSRSLGDEESWTLPDDDLERLDRVIEISHHRTGERPSLVTLLEGVDDARSEGSLRQMLFERYREVGIPDISRLVARSDRSDSIATELIGAVPEEARFQLARMVGASEPKRHMAELVIQASAGLTAAFATLPLPIADILPITTTQLVMVAAIAHLSGRRFNLRAVGEFMLAAGLNVGAGYALREIVRALVQAVPFTGSAVSSSIAMAATFAIGHAAIEYFIDDEDPEIEFE